MLTCPQSERPPRPGRSSGLDREPEAGARRRPRVLIVEDDRDMLEALTWCCRAAGWAVETATDGAEAIFVAQTHEPDAIVMDLRLPIVDGLDAIWFLKRNEETKHIPIVVCTAGSRSLDRAGARAAGCDEFVSKPCEPEAVREILEAVIAGRRGTPA